MAEDADYRQTCANSRKKWRENNPDYQRQYRQGHEAGKRAQSTAAMTMFA